MFFSFKSFFFFSLNFNFQFISCNVYVLYVLSYGSHYYGFVVVTTASKSSSSFRK